MHGLMMLQRTAGNSVVATVIQRKQFSYGKESVELDGSADFKSIVDKLSGDGIGPAQISKLANAFKEAAGDPSEDPAKLESALAIARSKIGNAVALRPKAGKPLTAAQTHAKSEWTQAQAVVLKAVQERRRETASTEAAAAKSAEDATTRATHARMYWTNIQAAGAGANPNVAAPLQWLISNGYISIAAPHRCFLSRYERKNKQATGPRDGLKFGLSAELVVQNIPNPGPRCVLHLHCDDKGKILSAGVKYYDTERQAGDNVVMTNVQFLQYDHGLTGETVEQQVGAFS